MAHLEDCHDRIVLPAADLGALLEACPKTPARRGMIGKAAPRQREETEENL
jgi:hypothetical protein